MPNHDLSLHNDGIVAVSVDTTANTLRIAYGAGWTKLIAIPHVDAQELVDHDSAVNRHGPGPGI